MKKISQTTFVLKRVFPAIWFGFLAVFLIMGTATGQAFKEPMIIVVPIIMAVMGYFMFKEMLWVLADEVYDCGDFLLIKKGPLEDNVYFSNVMNVSATTMMNPPHITLRLISAGRLGDRVTFAPETKFSLNPFATNPIAEDLMMRAYKARQKSGV